MIQNINNEKINKLLYYLLFVGFLLLPIDNFPYFSFAGEIGRRLGLYPFIIIIPTTLMLIIMNKNIFIDINNFFVKIVGAFYVWTIISILLNLNTILGSVFKGRTGIEKLLLQILVLTFMVLVSYSVFFIVKRNKLGFEDIRKFVMGSFVIVGIYCVFELLTLLNIVDFSWLIQKISYFVHNDNRGIFYERGVRGLSGEASYFGMYISFVLPWVFSYIFTEKKPKYVFIFLYLLLITFFTKSRFAIAIIYVQVFLFFALFIYNMKINIDKKKIVGVFVASIIVVAGLVNAIYDKGGVDKNGNASTGVSITQLVQSLTDPNNYSNIARVGLMQTAVSMGLDNPIKGVGLGQFAFHANEYVDEKALVSHEVQNWLDDNSQAWTPAFSLHTRILAEQGVIGFLIWSILWCYTLYKLFVIWKSKNNDYYGLTLIVSICGVLASGFNADTYAFLPYWVLISLSYVYINDNKVAGLNINKNV